MTEDLQARRSVLQSLLALDRPLDHILADLRAIGWDSDPVVLLTPDHLRDVLKRYMAGVLTAEQVEAWANAIEGREDIDVDAKHREIIEEILFDLANPVLQGKLSPAAATRWLWQLDSHAREPSGSRPDP